MSRSEIEAEFLEVVQGRKAAGKGREDAIIRVARGHARALLQHEGISAEVAETIVAAIIEAELPSPPPGGLLDEVTE